MSFQPAWRTCSKCASMFFNGNSSKGVCPAGGDHASEILDFNLPFDVPESPNAQDAWRFCQKCEALFFAGYGFQGVCKANGEHSAQGLNFVLPHDVPQTSGTQGGWRFCIKCFVMFRSAFGVKSMCAASGEHVAEGFQFVLPFEEPVPAPPSGLGSNSNYFLHCFCNPIKSLAIFVDITEDMVVSSVFGWSIQLNCYSTINNLDAWQQYVIQVYNPPEIDAPYAPVAETYISAVVNNWPVTGGSLINYADLLGGSQQYNLIPAGYRFSITLSTDENNNVVGVAYDLFDRLGTRLGVADFNLLQLGLTPAEIAPIIACQVNIVGPFNAIPATFTSGAGTITYIGVPDLNVVNAEPSCAESGYITAETANTFYSALPATTSGSLIQSFNTSSAVPMILQVGKPRPPLKNMFNPSQLK